MFRVEETQWAQAQKPEAPSVQRNKGADTGNGCGSHFMGGGALNTRLSAILKRQCFLKASDDNNHFGGLLQIQESKHIS